jgi:stage V sporulation protein AE
MVLFVVAGVVLGILGIYPHWLNGGEPELPCLLSGLEMSLQRGVIEDVDKMGLLGAFSGGVRAGSVGIAAAVFFGYIMALLSKPKAKNKN